MILNLRDDDYSRESAAKRVGVQATIPQMAVPMLSSEFNRLDLLFELLAMKSVRTDPIDSVPPDEGAAIPRDDQRSWHQSSFDLSRGCNVSERPLDELPAELLDQLVAQASRAKPRGA